jgi:putative DNA methylase
MPLIKSFILCSKKGKEVWIRPLVEGKAIRFEIVNKGKPLDPPKIGRGAKFRCLRCGQIASETYIKAQGMASHMGMQLMAMVGEGNRGRVYREPSREHERVAESARPDWEPDQELASDPRNIWCVQYGLSRFQHLFTNRQLTALNTFSDLVAEAQKQLRNDGASPGYAKAVITYLALGVSRLVNRTSTVCFWDQAGENVQQVFARQAIPMTWDFVEGNPLSNSTGNFLGQIDYLSNALESVPAAPSASVEQLDAITACPPSKVLFSTDPPYYDNISYANLSDFFYVWLRKALKDTYPSLFSTLLVPKKQELVAIPYRFKHGRAEAKVFFEGGFNRAFAKMQACQNANYPLTVFYAFKQSEEESEYDGPQVSTGWETMLEGLLRAGFQVTGTWPVRTELTQNLKKAVSALASSIVLVCRPRQESAGVTSRRDFLAALKRELPSALKALQHGNIAPVDLAQAAIGPGMSIFSRYSKVIEMDGTAMRVRTALGLINQALDEVLSEQESDLDADTRFALAWFEERGFESGEYGRAEVLATAKAVSVRGLEESGILTSRAGKVRLLKRSELQDDWDPTEERDLTVWAATQHLIRALEISTAAAAELAAKLGGMAETARELAYRLYTLCDKKGWAEEAGSYNGLVVNWPAIQAQTEEFALRA